MSTQRSISDSESPLSATVDELKKRRTAFHPSNSGGTGGDNAVFGFTTKGTIQSYAYPCHRHLNQAPINETLAVYSVNCRAQEKNLPKKIFDYHFDWLTDPKRSPWRSLLAAEGEAEHTTREFMRDYGFVFSNLANMPANLLMNFLVVSRMPKEWPKTTLAWYRLVTEFAVDPALAYVAIRLFIGQQGCSDESGSAFPGNSDYDKANFRFASADFYDWHLDNSTSTEDYISNFVRGTPGKLDMPFALYKHDGSVSGGSAYAHINDCWGKKCKGITSPDSYAMFLFNTYGKAYGGYNTSGGKFSTEKKTEDVTNWFVSFENLVAIMHREEERIGLKNASRRKKAA